MTQHRERLHLIVAKACSPEMTVHHAFVVCNFFVPPHIATRDTDRHGHSYTAYTRNSCLINVSSVAVGFVFVNMREKSEYCNSTADQTETLDSMNLRIQALS